MDEKIEQARAEMLDTMDLDKISKRTLYLQEDIIEELHVLCVLWHKKARGHRDLQKLNNSAVVRVLFEMFMPFLMTMEQVENEETLKVALSDLLRNYHAQGCIL